MSVGGFDEIGLLVRRALGDARHSIAGDPARPCSASISPKPSTWLPSPAVEVYSADWVLPVEGRPIADGAVGVEDGRIAAVGPSSDLGGGRRFADAAIVPGFVNAHSHLEYAVYAGFGDGLADFSEWIALHIERKRRIGWDEFVAIAELGAADCLSSGITTVGDCS